MTEAQGQDRKNPISGGPSIPLNPEPRFRPGIRQVFDHWNFRRRKECRTIIRWLDGRSGERILDIGCGDGYYDALISNTDAHVVGVDLHAERLAIARSVYANGRTEYHSIDAERLGFEDASFDKAMSLCVMEHLNDDRRVMSHVFRLLKPGGVFVFSADSLSNPELRPTERLRHQMRYEVNNYYRVETIRPKLEEIGFEIMKTRYILTTPLTLSLVRQSWGLERLPKLLKPFYFAGNIGLNTVGDLASNVSERFFHRPDSGLTLLIKARKPAL